jgi:hypothetical protein
MLSDASASEICQPKIKLLYSDNHQNSGRPKKENQLLTWGLHRSCETDCSSGPSGGGFRPSVDPTVICSLRSSQPDRAEP